MDKQGLPVVASRNKREGGYLGHYISVYDQVPIELLRRRHHRQGQDRWRWPTLREIQRTATREAP